MMRENQAVTGAAAAAATVPLRAARIHPMTTTTDPVKLITWMARHEEVDLKNPKNVTLLRYALENISDIPTLLHNYENYAKDNNLKQNR